MSISIFEIGNLKSEDGGEEDILLRLQGNAGITEL